MSENQWFSGENQIYSALIRETNAITDGHATKNSGFLRTNASGNLKVTTLTLAATGTISEGDTSNTNVPTIGACVTFGDLWGGSAKTVSTSDPSGGDDGDFWFKYEA